jgi:hypothetical protein
MLPSAIAKKNKNAAIAMELDLQFQLLLVLLEYPQSFLAHYAITPRLHAIANNNNNNSITAVPEKIFLHEMQIQRPKNNVSHIWLVFSSSS